MPSGSGDAAGYIRLYNKNNILLKEKEVEMIQMVDEVDWQDQHVSIKFIADWDLP